MEFRTARRTDISSIMEIERQPGFDDLIGRYSHAEHECQLADPLFQYQVLEMERGVQAFVIMHRSNSREMQLKRLAVRQPGKGVGKLMLASAIEHIFAISGTEILWLRVAAHNAAARRLYRDAGFQEMDVTPQAGLLPNGRPADLVRCIMDKTACRAWTKKN